MNTKPENNQAEQSIDPQTLANQVAAISIAMNQLLRSGLNRKAIVVLIKDVSGLSARDINLVLDSLKVLRERYTTIQAPTQTKK